MITSITLLSRNILRGWYVWDAAMKETMEVQMTRLAADYGDTEACTLMGTLCYEGDLTRIDHRAAVCYLRRAADDGDRDAQYLLGRMYLEGIMIGRDVSEAFFLFREASMNGSIDALYQLGLMYRKGIYVRKDEMSAYDCFRRCSEAGMEISQDSTESLGTNEHSSVMNL